MSDFLLLKNIIIALALMGIWLIPGATAEMSDNGFVFNDSVRPGDNFFSYVNDAWIAEHPIPADKSSYRAFDELRDKVDDDLHVLFEKAANTPSGETNHNISLVGQFYRSGMDTEMIDREGILPLTDDLTMISAITTREDLTNSTISLLELGFTPIYSYYAEINPLNSSEMVANVEQGGLGLPDRDYYMRNDSESLEIQEAYLNHIARVFVLMGETEEQATKDAKTVYEMEKTLASAHYTNEENQDPQKTSNLYALVDLIDQYPAIGWESLRSIPESGPVTKVNIHQPRFVQELNTLLKTAPIEDWKTFLRFHLVNSAAPYISSPFEEEDFAFNSKTLNGVKEMKPRWKRIVQNGNNLLGDAVGIIYVSEYVDPRTRGMVSSIFNSLRQTLRDHISNLTWMDESTKKAAHEKLDAMREKIAFPDRWTDYSGLNLSDSYVLNFREASAYNFIHGPEGLEKIGKPIDHNVWFISPQIVNAFYDITWNEIVFPAAILQPPFFEPDADNSQNYGALGWIIGHEMTHGFDDEGRQFDKDGNLRDWWTEADARNYSERTNQLVIQYNGYEVLPGLNINGNLTLGENIADFGGLTLAYYAWKNNLEEADNSTLSNVSPDRQFFFAAANVWKGSYLDEDLRNLVYSDPHSPDIYRVNGVLYNIPEFYTAFPEISPEDALFRDVDQRPVIW